MVNDKIFFDEKDPTGLTYNTSFTVYGSWQGRLWSKAPAGTVKYYVLEWMDASPKPTKAEIDAEIAYLESVEYKSEQRRKSISISRRLFKIGETLYEINGIPLINLIQSLLESLPEPMKTIASISYKESTEFDRTHQFVLQFSAALGMSDEEVDEFFDYCLEERWNNLIETETTGSTEIDNTGEQ